MSLALGAIVGKSDVLIFLDLCFFTFTNPLSIALADEFVSINVLESVLLSNTPVLVPLKADIDFV